MFHAVVDPSASGLRTAPGLERTVKLSLDGNKTQSTVSATARQDVDGLVYFDIPLSGLAAGKHSLNFAVANNVGLSAGVAMDFIVGTQAIEAVMTADGGEGAAVRESISFAAEGCEGASARLIVVDRFGRTVLSVPSCSFPYVWNLEGADGARCPTVNTAHGRFWTATDAKAARRR